MVFILIFNFIFFNINIFSKCCCYQMDKNNNNINIENNDSNNDLKDKNKKYDESKNIKKNNINYRKSKIKFINGKCGYQILLLTLCNLFKDKDDILDDFENGRNLKDDSPENRDFLKKIAEIVKKYKNSTNNNQIDVDDFIKVYLISLIYNCKKVTSIVIKTKKLKTVGAKAFTGINKKAVVKLPKTKKKAYKKLLLKNGMKKSVKFK